MRLRLIALLLAGLLLAGCGDDDPEQASNQSTATPSAAGTAAATTSTPAPGTPTPRPSATAAPTPSGPRILAQPQELVPLASQLGEDWRVERDGTAVSAQFTRTYVPRVLPHTGAERMGSTVSLYDTTAEAVDTFRDQWGDLDKVTTYVKGLLANRPLDRESIKVSALTEGAPDTGLEQASFYCATFTPTGSPDMRLIEVFGFARQLNLLIIVNAVALHAEGCAGELPVLPDLARLVQLQVEKVKAVTPR